MTTAGQVFEFPLSGERIIVRTSCRETNGTLAVFEFVQPHRAKPTFAHFHLTRDEEFEILAGSANYRLNGVAQIARAGDRFTVPLGATHVHPWNTTDEELRFLMTIRASQPDLQGMLAAEQGFATLARRARRQVQARSHSQKPAPDGCAFTRCHAERLCRRPADTSATHDPGSTGACCAATRPPIRIPPQHDSRRSGCL
jgi:uncharacterized cupin superfamily protein